MAGVRYYTPNPFEVNQNGVPLAGAQLFFYLTGTDTLFDTFSDVNLTVPNTNPVIADANGRFGSIFLQTSQAYGVQLWTAPTTGNPTGSQIWAEDPVGPAAGGVPQASSGIVGEVRAYAGLASSIPQYWYLAAGQAVDRTTYAAAFAVMGTSWGNGDGSTTFNLPDLRGRVPAGLDNMGGTAANRITSGVAGISGTTLGAAGGSQAVQTHTHVPNDPEHSHTPNDPEHNHPPLSSSPAVFLTSGGSRPGGGAGAYLNNDDTTGNAATGITIQSAATGITIGTYGAGTSQNVQPTAMVNYIIYLGA